jgi:tetratricopeptide (TPR) repeat protein
MRTMAHLRIARAPITHTSKLKIFHSLAIIIIVATTSCISPPAHLAPAVSPQDIIHNLAPGAIEFAGYGGYQKSISTTSDAAQNWFDRGIQLVYGFNHDAAVHAFARAAQEDPECAMAWWGIAYSYGVDVNNPDVSELEAQYANIAINEAIRLKGNATPAELSLIEAAAFRAVYPLPGDRTEIDLSYSQAMSRAWDAHQDDPDIGAMYAESLMNMQRWDYWSADGEALGNTEELLSVLDDAMALNNFHPGANHFYIHAIEASKTPEKGIPSAERLKALVPGSGHLVHMPSHIFVNVGRYADAVSANQRAIDADASYFSQVGTPTFYRIYFLHNIHFLTYAAMMTGQKELALETVLKMETELPAEMLQAFAENADSLSSVRLHVYMRFGMWQELVDFPEYEEDRHVSRAMRAYTRSIALANLLRTDEAREEFARFKELRQEVPSEWTVGSSAADDVLSVAENVALGEILWREGEVEPALDALRTAVDQEHQLLYAEPPGWMIPVRHVLGAILLAADQPVEAQSVYEVDLDEHPGNAWSLLGITQSLRMQNKVKEADAYTASLNKAWINADVTPPASCYCGAVDSLD